MARKQTAAARRAHALLSKAEAIEGLPEVLEEVIGSYVERARTARGEFKRFHWGEEPTDLQEAMAPLVLPDEVLWSLGDLAEIAYEGTKNGEPAIWVHTFKAQRPVLAYSEHGLLVIVGGDYRVTPRGIVG